MASFTPLSNHLISQSNTCTFSFEFKWTAGSWLEELIVLSHVFVERLFGLLNIIACALCNRRHWGAHGAAMLLSVETSVVLYVVGG